MDDPLYSLWERVQAVVLVVSRTGVAEKLMCNGNPPAEETVKALTTILLQKTPTICATC
jgi:hypothetical protein